MKVEPIFSFRGGFLVPPVGTAVPAKPAQIQVKSLFEGAAEAKIAALAEEGFNLFLLRVSLLEIASDYNSFNEAFLARLREILKSAEKNNIGAVIQILPDENAPHSDAELLLSSIEHTARRLKDCSALLGFTLAAEAGSEFHAEAAIRLKKKHPSLIFFIEPSLKGDPSPPFDYSEPFIGPALWPRAWVLED